MSHNTYSKIKDPMEEKLKRLYNSPKLTQEDSKYLNFQFEQYKIRNLQIMGVAFFGSFLFQCIPKVYNSSKFKYWSTTILVGYSIYISILDRNNTHFQTICAPYFEKYKVK